MNRQELAKKIATKFNFPVAEKYDLSLREFDNMIEVIGLMNDPNVDPEEIDQLNINIPKCWLTVGVIPANAKVNKEWL